MITEREMFKVASKKMMTLHPAEMAVSGRLFRYFLTYLCFVIAGRCWSIKIYTCTDILRSFLITAVSTGVGLDRIFIFVVSDPSILPIWPLLIAL